MRSPTLLPMRMNAADTSASSAIADWTPLTVVCRSCTTAAMETFITDVSTTRTNIAIASRMASLRSSLASAGAPTADLAVTADHHPGSHALPAGGLRVLRSAKATSGWADQPGPAPPHRPHRVRRYLSRDIPLSRRWHLESPAIGRPRSGIMTRSWVARYYGT